MPVPLANPKANGKGTKRVVSCTSKPEVLRVSFVMPESEGSRVKDAREVVCYAVITPRGLELAYSHHAIRYRSGTVGPFDGENEVRMPLTSALKREIETAAMYELMSALWGGGELRMLEPGEKP